MKPKTKDTKEYYSSQALSPSKIACKMASSSGNAASAGAAAEKPTYDVECVNISMRLDCRGNNFKLF